MSVELTWKSLLLLQKGDFPPKILNDIANAPCIEESRPLVDLFGRRNRDDWFVLAYPVHYGKTFAVTYTLASLIEERKVKRPIYIAPYYNVERLDWEGADAYVLDNVYLCDDSKGIVEFAINLAYNREAKLFLCLSEPLETSLKNLCPTVRKKLEEKAVFLFLKEEKFRKEEERILAEEREIREWW